MSDNQIANTNLNQANEIQQNNVDTAAQAKDVGVFKDHKLTINGISVKLNNISPISLLSPGWFASNKEKISLAKVNLNFSYVKVFDNLINKNNKLEVKKLLKALKAVDVSRADLQKLEKINLRNVGNIGIGGHNSQLDFNLEIEASLIERLSNEQLSAIFQTFNSAEMEFLQDCLQQEGENRNSRDSRSAASHLFDIQAMVLKEISNRALAEKVANNPALLERQEQEVQLNAKQPKIYTSLTEQFGGTKAQHANQKQNLSATNLEIIAEVSTKSANNRSSKTESANADLKNRRLDNLSLKKLGDSLRNNDLVINMPSKFVLSGSTSLFDHPDKPLVNVFHLKEQGINAKGDVYLNLRDEVEKKAFPTLEGHEVKAKERPLYGTLNISKKRSGTAAYGRSVIVLKPEVKKRATYICGDTFKALPLTISEDNIKKFYTLLPAENLPLELKEQLADENSEMHKEMQQFLEMIKNGTPDEQTSNITNSLSTQARKIFDTFIVPNDRDKTLDNENTFIKLFIKSFADPDKAQQKMASFDNLENLIVDMPLLDKNALAQSHLKAVNGQEPSVFMHGADYIEGQIQGEIIPERDIAEIRLYIGQSEEMDVSDENPQVVSPEKKAEIIRKAEEFSKRTGVKVTYIDDAYYAASDGYDELDSKQLAKFHASHLNIADFENDKAKVKAKLNDRLKEKIGTTKVHKTIRQQIEQIFEDEVADLLKDGFLNDSNEAALESALNHALRIIDDRGGEIYDRIKPLKLDPQSKAQLCAWALSFEQIPTDAQLKKQAILVRCEDLNSNLSERVSGYLKDHPELTASLPEGMTLELTSPYVLGRIMSKTKDLALDLRQEKPDATPDELISEAFAKQVGSLVRQKVELLSTLRTLKLPPKQEAAVSVWVKNAGKILNSAELKLVVNTALEQSQLFKDIIRAQPPLTQQQILNKYADFYKHTNLSMAEFLKTLAEPLGADELYKEYDRFSFMSKELLLNDEQEVTKDDLVRLQQSLDSAEMRKVIQAIDKIGNHYDTFQGINNGILQPFKAMITNNCVNLSEHTGIAYNDPYEPDYGFELISKSTRDYLCDLAPSLKQDFEKVAPPLQSMPAPALPEKMPTTHEERTRFCISTLDKYKENEKTFDGAGVHGRGHIVRAFIAATVLSNILEEKYHISVDKNAVLLGISGHDAGRTQNGTDYKESEQRSAEFTVQNARKLYGEDSLGPEYEEYLKGTIVHESEKSNTIEGMVLRSADSLDIQRVFGIEDYKRDKLEFLNGPKMPTGANRLRENLIKEMRELELLTDHLCRVRPMLNDYIIKMAETQDSQYRDELNEKKMALEAETQRNIEKDREIPNDQYFALIEKLVKKNAMLFPTLNKYYH
ncbi:MAG: DUF3626 domain-containing protein [Succinivibrio sp.]|nr:DUF3626 domain-containing protein [Succinivibrio sp.]